MQRDEPVRRARQGRRRRWILALSASALLLVLACSFVIRNYADEWIRDALQRAVADTLDGRLEFSNLEVDLLRLETHFDDLRLEMPHESLTLEIRSGDIRLTWSSLPAFLGSRLRLAEVRLESPRLRIEVPSGSASTRGSDRRRPFDVRIDRLDVIDGRLDYDDAEVPFELAAEGLALHALWDVDRRELAGDVRMRVAVRRAPLVRPLSIELGGEFRLRPHDVDLVSFHARGDGLTVAFESNIRFPEEMTVTGGGIVNVDLTRLAPLLEDGFPTVAGRVSGPVSWEQGPEGLRVRGDISARDATFGRFRADTATAKMHYRAGRLELLDLVASTFGGIVNGDVSVDMGPASAFRAQLTGSDLRSGELFDWMGLPLPFASRLDARIVLSGDSDNFVTWTGEGSFVAEPASDAGSDLAVQAQGEFGLADGRLRVVAPSVELAALRATMDLDVDLGAEPLEGWVNLTGFTADARATQMGALRILEALGSPPNEMLTRSLSGKGTVTARISMNGGLDLTLALREGGIAGQPFDRADVELTLAESTLTLHGLELENETTRVRASGRMAMDPVSVDELMLEAEGLDVRWLSRLMEVEAVVDGQLGGRVEIRGVGEARVGFGELVLLGGSWMDQSFDEMRADVTIDSGAIRLESLRLVGPGLDLDGTVVWLPADGRAVIEIDRGTLRLGSIQALGSWGLPIAGTMIIDGNLAYSQGAIEGGLRIGGSEWSLWNRVLGTVQGRAEMNEQGFRVSLAGDAGSGWRTSGQVKWEDGLSFTAEVVLEDAPIELAEWDPAAWSARLTASLELDGELRHLEEIRAAGVVSGGEIRRGDSYLSIAEPVRMKYEDRRASVSPILLTGPGSEVRGSADYDLARNHVDLELHGHLDLAVLTAPFAEIRAAGRVDLDVEAHGDPARPRARGSLEARNARLRLLGYPSSLDQLTFRIGLEGENATLESLRARFGNGEIHAEGSARLAGFGIDSFRVAVDAANVKAEFPEGLRGVYEGKVQLQGGPDGATLSGRVKMLRGLYEQDFGVGGMLGSAAREYSPTRDTGLADNLELDLSLVADGNVWMRNDLAEVESNFDLHLGGSLRNPQLTGRLRVLEGGQLWFRNVEYELETGSLDFVEVDRIDPYITLRARTTVKDYTVFLRVEGTLNRFEYELTSEPVLTTQDIIALLTTGNTLEEITAGSSGSGAPFTGDLAANYFAGALSAPFEKQLGRLLGLERVSINPLLVEGDADPTTRITLAQQVADDLMVVFSTDVGKTERQLYEVDWHATKRLRFGARRDTLGGIGGSVHFTDRFWWNRPEADPPDESPDDVAEPRGVMARDAGTRLASISINGAAQADLGGLNRRLGLRIGDPFSRSGMFNGVEAIKRYYVGTGRIETQVDASVALLEAEAHVAYTVVPGPVVDVVFEGVGKKERKKLRALLGEVWVESVFSDDLYIDSVNRIRDHFQEGGFYAVDVQFGITETEGRKKVRFEIDRGKPVRVEEIVFLGVESLPEERLLRQMLTRRSSGLARRVLVPKVLDADLAAIRTLYREDGFLRAQVDPARINLSMRSDTATITIAVAEGPRYTVESVGFTGDTQFSRAELEQWAALAPGDVFSPSSLLRAESRLRAGIDSRGYPDARVRADVETGASTVQVRFQVQPGGVKRVKEIRITGNILTRDKVIRRAVELHPGDPISREKVLASQHGLYRLGLFRNVRLGYGPLDPANPVDQILEVSVDEGPPLSASVGAGYDTEARGNVSFSLTHENLGGYDRILSVQGKYSGLERRIQVVGKEPRLFNHDLAALATVGWEKEEEVGFTAESPSIALRVERQFDTRWKGFVRYEFQRVDLSNVTISPEELEEEKLVDGRLGQLGVAVVRDTRDDRLLTRKGGYATAGIQVFARPLLSEFTFVQSVLTGSRVWPVKEASAFASSIRIGLAFPFGSNGTVPISEAFFAGGDSTIRGFSRDTVGPASGGEALFILNEEIRFPIWRSLKGVTFYDAGNVYREVSDFDLTDLRHVLGVGLRFETLIGPLRLEYGRKLDREAGESQGELFLAIGSAF